jgi:hypothetical protein
LYWEEEYIERIKKSFAQVSKGQTELREKTEAGMARVEESYERLVLAS